MSMPDYGGILFIGDPHLSSRTPGFRKDEYASVILNKLRWCLDYARNENLLPAVLGDLFHLPRDNSNWLLGELCALFIGREIVTIYGNHDCRENTLCDDDSLSVLVKANLLTMVSEFRPWRGTMNGRKVVVGGTSFNQFFPLIFNEGIPREVLVFWMAHHDMLVPGYEHGGRMDTREIPGVDVVVNGHIHRKLDDVQSGKTRWLTPGNITRIKRSDRLHVPAVLRVDVDPGGWTPTYITVPHEPFESVFHEQVAPEPVQTEESAFVRGLAELQARRTASGAGLEHFLQENLDQFEPEVAVEVRRLATQVMESVA